MSKPKSRVIAVRVVGPLAPYARQFTSLLAERGYTPLSTVNQLQVMVHLSKWLRGRGLDVVNVTFERVDEYLTQRRAEGYSSFCSRASLEQLLDVLGRCGAPLVEPTLPGSEVDTLLAGFAGYLRQERGLAASTTSAYVLRARRFVNGYGHDADLTQAGQRRCHPGGAARGQHSDGRVGAVLRGGAAFIPALRVSDGLDPHRPVRGVAVGDRAVPLGPAAGHRPGRREGTAGFV